VNEELLEKKRMLQWILDVSSEYRKQI